MCQWSKKMNLDLIMSFKVLAVLVEALWTMHFSKNNTYFTFKTKTIRNNTLLVSKFLLSLKKAHKY